MKIVTISDTHNKQPQNLPEGDILIHAGDLTALGRHGETQRMLDWLGEQRNKFKHVILTAGNHDFLFEREPYLAQQMCLERGITYLENSGITIEGIKFFGSPWTPKFYNWAFMKSESDLLRMYHAFPEDIDVLITHGPAYGILDDNDFGEKCGSMALKEAMRWIKPKIHVYGHIHRSNYPAEKREISILGGSYLSVNAAQVNDSNELKSYKKPVVVEI